MFLLRIWLATKTTISAKEVVVFTFIDIKHDLHYTHYERKYMMYIKTRDMSSCPVVKE